MQKQKKFDARLDPVSVPTELKEKLKAHSERTQLSMSAIARLALESYLSKAA